MEEERENSARTVRYFSGGGYYVHSCPPDVSICSQVPGFETTITGQQIGSNISTSSLALLEAVNAIDSDEDEEKEDHSYVDIVTDGQSKLNDSSSLNAADEIDSDDDSISYSGNSSSSLLPAEASKAALDLCPAIDTSMLESDSESENEESSEESEADVDSDNYDSEYGESVGKPSSDCYLPSWETDYLPVDQVDDIIRTDMEELEAKKPWRSVFRCLDVPFGFRHRDDPFDIFFMRWDEFWHAHGRALLFVI
ncbi:hypothetical protein BBJ29_000928 [Phytophthora kernoviae]|uniref:Uncharacterized protein n=1 Tax=Phytophthora kernoviae TaxID=325452 RepID=A0A3F2RX98_9STRA|nr:hypothetical protein BBJ29_000928 [Phytophthora kernoviae]RLN66069.1 hypothetical protein BBP00_00002447 [Phytophthora kernoviae]